MPDTVLDPSDTALDRHSSDLLALLQAPKNNLKTNKQKDRR